MKYENGPQGAAPEILALQRNDQTQSTTGAHHTLALARAGALAIVTSATANGTFEPTEAILSATAGLASSLYFDLWAAVA